MAKSRPGTQTSRTVSIPAPTGGLNAKDALANMAQTDAVIMDNMFPKPTSVVVRNGYVDQSTGLPDWVETLAYYSGDSTQALFAISDGSIYDATTSGPVGMAAVTGLTNSRFQFVNFGNSAGRFILFVNGEDKLHGFDGTSWWVDGDGAHDIATLDTSTAIHCAVFKNRVWFVEKDSMNAWYLPTSAIAGTAAALNLAPVFKLGGYLMAITSWTIDNISGIDDYAVFISSEGEFAIYKGTDPTSASTFALVGVFRVGRPIGRRCCLKVASDVLLLCADGVYPLSQALLTDRKQNKAISDKIVNLVNSDVQTYKANFGWQMMLYPLGNKLIVNVPQSENSIQYQYVMNTINDSWCRFTGWNAACWEFFNDGIYFGGNTIVGQADTGTNDNGANISASVKQAFSYFGEKGRQKRFTMCRLIFNIAGTIKPAIAMNVDFEDKQPTSVPTFSGAAGSPWDTSPWNTSPWSATSKITKDWISVSGIGFAGALKMNISVKYVPIEWQSTDFVFEAGAVL